jgi:hypothetical protein
MSSDIGAELENHTVGRGPMYDRKGLNSLRIVGRDRIQFLQIVLISFCLSSFVFSMCTVILWIAVRAELPRH